VSFRSALQFLSHGAQLEQLRLRRIKGAASDQVSAQRVLVGRQIYAKVCQVTRRQSQAQNSSTESMMDG